MQKIFQVNLTKIESMADFNNLSHDSKFSIGITLVGDQRPSPGPEGPLIPLQELEGGAQSPLNF